jgi:hypothetical protein
MNRKLFLLLALAGTFTLAPLASGQSYSATVLYPLTPPSGSEFAAGIVDISASGRQTIGNAFVEYPGGPTLSAALLWTASGAVVLNPDSTYQSVVRGTDGIQQVGFVNGSAMLWTGTAASAVDLNPTNLNGITQSAASGTDGTQQVGVGSIYSYSTSVNTAVYIGHAVLWSGSAGSAVDLNPAGFANSSATGVGGNQQVGSGSPLPAGGTNTHALLWTGTAASAVDLNPTNLTGFSNSQALATDGSQRVGFEFNASPNFQTHALLWTGTAASAVDLNPSQLGFYSSTAEGTNGTEQVGFGYSGDAAHALLWSGTADSAVDLNALLPLTGNFGSEAYSIDASGNIYGVASYTGVNAFAVEWSPVPEPAAGSLLLTFAAGLILRRRRSPRRILCTLTKASSPSRTPGPPGRTPNSFAASPFLCAPSGGPGFLTV